MKNILLLIVILAGGLLIAGGCTNQISKPTQTNTVAGAPEVPKTVQTLVSDRTVILSWEISDPSLIARYMIYRGDTGSSHTDLIDSTTQLTFTDGALRNGLRYIYQVSSLGLNGLESKRSTPVSATPNIFAVSISSGAKYVRSVDVSLGLVAPGGTQLVKISNDSTFSGSTWQAFSANRNWQLTPGDGVKSVYARFRDVEGNETSHFVQDSVILDTRASIISVTENSNGQILHAGDQIHFTLDGGESGGVASVAVSSLGTINLVENAAQNGVYETDYVIPGGVSVVQGTVTGSFTDAAGNQAAARAALTFVTVANPPEAVTLSAFVVSESEIELDWSRSTTSDFGSYRLFRSDSANVTTGSTLLTTQTDVNSTSFRDNSRKPATDYYYAVFTVDKAGQSAQSNIVKATTFANLPPKAVTLFVTNQDSTSVTLGWTPNDDKDFAAYRIYRAASAGVPTQPANLTGVVTGQSTISFVDNNIVKGQKFYYVVVVVDKWGVVSPTSNEVNGPNQ